MLFAESSGQFLYGIESIFLTPPQAGVWMAPARRDCDMGDASCPKRVRMALTQILKVPLSSLN